ncbi:hypothetical protein UF75_2220 [Desulfosporosinus sp. I2]|nr:hypothetical protein UF75_2220 [Desulfosporosinus sp. I2]
MKERLPLKGDMAVCPFVFLCSRYFIFGAEGLKIERMSNYAYS